MQQQIARATQAGLTYLRARQQPNGSFASHSSKTQRPFQQDYMYRTTFVPALICGMLAKITHPDAVKIRQSLAPWLLAQKSPHWSFNYWAAESAERKTQPYPDDLDDTFCALAGLYLHDPALVDSKALAHVARLLIAAESQVGGPYRTWLAAKDAPGIWLDTDLAVNSNIAYFLRLAAEPLPNLTALLESAIATRTFSSIYYPSEYPLVYYAARAYRGPLQPNLARHVLAMRKQGQAHWGTPLQTALAISAVLQAGTAHAGDLSAAARYLLDTQRFDGSWPAEAFCLDPAKEGRPYYHGAAVLSTACALEALQAYQAATAPVIATAIHDSQSQKNPIMALAQKQLANLAAPLNSHGLATLDRLRAGDRTHEISLLPQRFAQSLSPHGLIVPESMLANLSLANVYGWMAYTVYDDFLDGEGNPRALSAANTAMRLSLDNFWRALPGNQPFQHFVRHSFDRIDAANAWEVAYCRFETTGDYVRIAQLPLYGQQEKLAERSAGHGLGLIGTLAAAGLAPDHPDARALHAAFNHYLIARQLGDDMHDWQADTRAGHISYVVRTILADLHLPPGEYKLELMLPRMQTQFWHQTLNQVCTVSKTHISRSRKILTGSKLLRDNSVLHGLLDGVDATLNRTLHEQQQAKQFLTAYGADGLNDSDESVHASTLRGCKK